MLNPQGTPPSLCDIDSVDAPDEDFSDYLEEAFSQFEDLFQDLLLSYPFCIEEGIPPSEEVSSHKQTLWPHDAQTGEKLPWGTPLEKGKVVTYNTLKSCWPHNAQTGEKLAWGTPLEKGKVVTYRHIRNHWPRNLQTGEMLPWGTPLKKGKVITYGALKSRWPYSLETGKKLPWGTPLEKGKVIAHTAIQRRWPHDAQTGEKLPWGTPLEKDKVLPLGTLQEGWPYDAQTGEKLSLDTKIDGKNIVKYTKLRRMRPINKLTGAKLPYGTKFNEDIIKTYEFSMDYIFIGSNRKTYKGLNAKERAAQENPSLSFKSRRDLQREKRRSQRKDNPSGDASITTESDNPQKRSKQSLEIPANTSSCINALVESTFQPHPLMTEKPPFSKQSDQTLEFEPLSPTFLPSHSQSLTSNGSSNIEPEECGLSPSILFSGPGG